jgi:recombination protein RecA
VGLSLGRRETVAKEKKVALTKVERLNAVVGGMKKRHPGRIFCGDEYTMPWAVRRLPTGVPDLDIALSGGLPAGGMTMIIGQPSVGKNWLINQVLKKQQEIYGEECAIAVIGLEFPYDKGQANSCGVRVAMSDKELDADDARRKGFKLPPLTAEQREERKHTIGTFIIVPPTTAEESFDMVVELIETREFNVIVIDSFGSVLPEEDQDKSFEDENRVGGPSKLNTRLMRKMTAALAPDDKGEPNLTCVIGINQVRDNLKARGAMKTTQETGGWSLKHGRYVTIELTRTGNLSQAIKGRSGKRKYGKTIKWEITKQKAGGYEGHTGDYDYIMERVDIDREGLAVRLAAEAGIIKKAGNWYTYNDVQIGNGLAAASKFVIKNNLLEDLELEILRAHGCSYLL